MAQTKKSVIMVIASLLLLVGVYLLILVFAPQLKFVNSPYQQSDPAIKARQALPDQDYLYISKLNLMVPFSTGDKSVLEKGAWWRFPDRGSPQVGGNFILSAHRFKLGWTPQHTKKQSPFYYLDKIDIGDEITIHFDGADYRYQVTKEFAVKPNDTSIEAPSQAAKLTIYTCTLKGAADGRTVIEAKPLF